MTRKLKQMNSLIPIGGALYADVRTAIAKCHALDELKDMADKSTAMANYYEQVKDDESVRKFNEIRLRAYRRIGQIIVQGLDFSRCETQISKTRLVREHFKDDPTVKQLNDARIIQLIKLAGVPDRDFDGGLEKVGGSIEAMTREHPEFKAARAASKAAMERAANRPATKEEVEQQRAAAQARREIEAEQELLEELRRAHTQALGEVGFTMERCDRERMHKIVFLIKQEIHEILRRAAFDNRITMQEILRRGMTMWFTAHGYDVPQETIDHPPRRGEERRRGVS